MHRFERRKSGDFQLQSFSFTVLSGLGIVGIENPPGCTLKVLSGQAWITMDGDMRDVIAGPADTVRLRAGIRTHVSALHEAVTLMIAAPSHLHNAAFVVQSHNGERVIRITAVRSLAGKLSDVADGIAAAWRRWNQPSLQQAPGARP